MEKKCKKCNIVKDVSEFGKEMRNKDGLNGTCKVCIKTYQEEYRIANSEKLAKKKKEYYEANTQKHKVYQEEYFMLNKEKISKRNKDYRESNLALEQILRRQKKEENLGLLNEGKKRCSNCNVIKNFNEFHKNKTSSDSLSSYCKLCRNKKNREASIKSPSSKEMKAETEKKRLFKNGKIRCNKCNIVKNISGFGKAKTRKNGLKSICRVCVKNVKKIYTKNNKKKIKDYAKEYNEINKDKLKEKRDEKKEERVIYGKKHREKNKEKINDRIKLYTKSRRKTDSLYRLKLSVKSSVKRHIKGFKSKKTTEIIGQDYKEFQDYLGAEYQEGTHLDHIIPISWAINKDEIYTLNHYSNFQILTAEENMAKSNKYCKSENLKKVLDNHNDLTKLNQIIERNSDKIK